MDLGKHWKTLVDCLQDGLLVVDPGGTVVAANRSAEVMTGYTADELLGQSCRILNCTGCKIIGQGRGIDWCDLFVRGSVREKRCMITNKSQRQVDIIKSASVLRDDNGTMIGAVETLTDISESVRYKNELSTLRRTFQLDSGYHGILGTTPIIQNLIELIENASQSDTPVMILGESGTGKELVARALHEAGPRRDGPFIKVNCAALNQNILESELFGHIKGAYTGADRDRIGRFEAAHQGSIFLDEIGDLPMSTQVKLLRVLEEKRVEKVGDQKSIPVDVRVITATNKDLEKMLSQGEFREDLYFRINVFPIHCPSLADRSEDIPQLIRNLITINNKRTGKQIKGISQEAMERLISYPWPGNVRELRNVIEYAFVLAQGSTLGLHDLPQKIFSGQNQGQATERSGRTVNKSEIDAGRRELVQALQKAGGNKTRAASILGVSRVTVWKRMKKHGILDEDLLV
ncbi:MAG: sigma 54-interacting transcriptional regulator [Desulfohalobiaceae bacterium]|nr:sigma 54-interacting transcriptional regulator [Desulfohalobiaceae bacterium]